MSEMYLVYHASTPNPRKGMPGFVVSKLRREHMLDLAGQPKPCLHSMLLTEELVWRPLAVLEAMYPLLRA